MVENTDCVPTWLLEWIKAPGRYGKGTIGEKLRSWEGFLKDFSHTSPPSPEEVEWPVDMLFCSGASSQWVRRGKKAMRKLSSFVQSQGQQNTSYLLYSGGTPSFLWEIAEPGKPSNLPDSFVALRDEVVKEITGKTVRELSSQEKEDLDKDPLLLEKLAASAIFEKEVSGRVPDNLKIIIHYGRNFLENIRDGSRELLKHRTPASILLAAPVTATRRAVATARRWVPEEVEVHPWPVGFRTTIGGKRVLLQNSMKDCEVGEVEFLEMLFFEFLRNIGYGNRGDLKHEFRSEEEREQSQELLSKASAWREQDLF